MHMGQSTSPKKSAPCPQYLELQAFEVLESKAEEFEKAQFKEDLETTKKEIKEIKKPMLCLVTALNAAKAEVARGIAQMQKDIQAKASKVKELHCCFFAHIFAHASSLCGRNHLCSTSALGRSCVKKGQ